MRWLSTKTCRRKVDLLWQLVKPSNAGSLESGDTSHPRFTPESLSALHVEPSHKLTDVKPPYAYHLGRLSLPLLAKSFSVADELLPAHAGLKGNVVLYTTLMTVCHKGGKPERAMRIFRTMEGDGLQADVVRTPLTSHLTPWPFCITSANLFFPINLASVLMHSGCPSEGWCFPELPG